METYSASKDFRRAPWRLVLLAISLCLLPSRAFGQESKPDSELRHIKHIVVIYQENWSFDSLYGLFPRGQRSGAILAQIPESDRPVRPTSQCANRAAVQPGIRIAEADHTATTDQQRADRYAVYARTQYPASL